MGESGELFTRLAPEIIKLLVIVSIEYSGSNGAGCEARAADGPRYEV